MAQGKLQIVLLKTRLETWLDFNLLLFLSEQKFRAAEAKKLSGPAPRRVGDQHRRPQTVNRGRFTGCESL